MAITQEYSHTTHNASIKRRWTESVLLMTGRTESVIKLSFSDSLPSSPLPSARYADESVWPQGASLSKHPSRVAGKDGAIPHTAHQPEKPQPRLKRTLVIQGLILDERAVADFKLNNQR